MKSKIVIGVLFLSYFGTFSTAFAQDPGDAATKASASAELRSLRQESHGTAAAVAGGMSILTAAAAFKLFGEATTMGRTRIAQNRFEFLGMLSTIASLGSGLVAIGELTSSSSADRAVADAKISEVKEIGSSTTAFSRASASAGTIN